MLRHFGANAQRNAAVRQHRRRVGEADAIGLVFDRHGTEALADRDRDFAAGQEAGGFARQCRKIGLSERHHLAVSLAKVERAEDVEPEQPAQPAERGVLRTRRDRGARNRAGALTRGRDRRYAYGGRRADPERATQRNELRRDGSATADAELEAAGAVARGEAGGGDRERCGHRPADSVETVQHQFFPPEFPSASTTLLGSPRATGVTVLPRATRPIGPMAEATPLILSANGAAGLPGTVRR